MEKFCRTKHFTPTIYLQIPIQSHRKWENMHMYTEFNTDARANVMSLNSAQSIESIAEFDISVKCFTEAHILWKIEQMHKSRLRQRVHKFEPDLYVLVILLSHFNGFLLRKHFAFDFSTHCCCF